MEELEALSEANGPGQWGHVLGSAIPNSLGPDTPCPWHSCMLRSPVFGSRGVRAESITQEVHIRSERDGGEDLM